MKKNIEKNVLSKLFSRRVIGKNPIQLVTLTRCGWKAHERNQVKEAVKSLIKQDLIIWTNKSKKILALSKNRIQEIKQIIDKEA